MRNRVNSMKYCLHRDSACFGANLHYYSAFFLFIFAENYAVMDKLYESQALPFLILKKARLI